MKKAHVIKVVPIQKQKNTVNKNFRTWCGRCGKLAALGAEFVEMVLICQIAINKHFWTLFCFDMYYRCIVRSDAINLIVNNRRSE